jgi:glycosyltransferase involved in cell wall biosynthesis
VVVEGRISVIVPVFEMGHYLPDAVASIEAQGHPDVEIVVVDDGSSDDTPSVIAALGDRVLALRQDNRGPSAARNTGLAAATGDIIGFCDADDLWPDDKLAVQLGHLAREPELDAVLGRIQYVSIDGAPLPDIEYEDLEQKTVSHVNLGCGLFRRRAFDRLGSFDEALRYSEDLDWFLRARESGMRLAILPEVTLRYRRHDTNMTRDAWRPVTASMLTAVKQSLDRRRAAGLTGELPRWGEFDLKEPDQPTVTVVIASGGARDVLRESIRAALEQTHRVLEVLVVDDGSDDHVEAVSNRFGSPVRVLRGSGSVQAVLDAGLTAAGGEYVAVLTPGVRWETTRLADQLRHVAADRRLDAVVADDAVLLRTDVVARLAGTGDDTATWHDRLAAAGCRLERA